MRRVCGPNGVSGPVTPRLMAPRERCSGDQDTGRVTRKSKREPTAEERAAEEMVRWAWGRVCR